MAKTKTRLLEQVRDIATAEMDGLPELLKAMTPDKRAVLALKLLSLTLESDDVYCNEKPGFFEVLPKGEDR